MEGVSLKEVFPYEGGMSFKEAWYVVRSCGRGHSFWGGVCPLGAGLTLMQKAYLYRNLWEGACACEGVEIVEGCLSSLQEELILGGGHVFQGRVMSLLEKVCH